MSDKTELEILNKRIDAFEIWMAKSVAKFQKEPAHITTTNAMKYVLGCYQVMVMNKEEDSDVLRDRKFGLQSAD
tara:strand:- start:268 stop:489 length:222 start_codon:yes stop_codon:yes gene_type:complete